MTARNLERLSWIFGRRSIRLYAPGSIKEDDVTLLLQAAMAAPSAMTKDPWRFIVIRQPHKLAELAAILPGGKMLSTAALALVVCGDLDVAFERQLSFLLQDCSAAIENTLLAAHGLGLGACWVGLHPAPDSIREVSKLLALPGSIIPIAAIAVGQPGEQPESRTRFNPAYVHFETW
jgi:nitroreductase